ncbi:hypothetical protein FGF1_00570 [Flavobacteriaceae bacterium GF1]
MVALTGLFFTSCSDDDDQPVLPGINVSVTQDTFSEGDGTIAVSFTTTDAFTTDVTLTYEVSGTATAGEDYEALSGSLVLGAGQRTVTQNLVIIDDDAVEPSEEIILTLTAVNGATDFIGPSNSITITLTDNDSFPFENGILVLHEGGFGRGDSSMSFVTADLSTVENGIFKSVNEVDAWGDTAQSMAFNGDLGYIVVNNSQKVEVVNRYTFESVATIGGADEDDFLNPRYMAIVNGTGYVTNWGDGLNPNDDFVAVVNLENNTVESRISVAEGPERLIVKDNTIYVSMQGGFGQNNIITVIDATTNMVTTTIPVANRPNTLQLDANDNLWVLSGGNPAFTGNETAGQLDRINIATNTVEATFEFAQTEHPNYLSIDGDALYYYLGGNVFEFNVSDTALPSSPEIEGVSFYDMTVNDGRLYGVDAKDFRSPGSLDVYDLSDNSRLTSLEVDLNPGEVYFNGTAER